MTHSYTLRSVYEHHLLEAPNATMLIQEGQHISYWQFEQLVQDTETWLGQQGVKRGDHVAVWLINRVEWLAIFFALARLGATLVAVNTKYRSHEVHYILANSHAQFLILQLNFRKIDFAEVIKGVDASNLTHLKTIMMVDADDNTPPTLLGRPVVRFLPTLAKPSARSSSDPPKAFSDASQQRTTVDSFEQTQPDTHAFAQPEPNSDHTQSSTLEDLPVIFFTTSGTTKGPKLVVHTQKTLSEHVRHIATGYQFGAPGDALLTALPLCGVYGLDSALAAIAARMPVVLMDFFDVASASQLIKQHQITHIFGSDEMLRRFAEQNPEPIAFTSLKLFGFAAFSARFIELAQELIPRGFPMRGLYGSSEVHSLFSAQHPELPLEERVLGGGTPAAGARTSVRVRDPDTLELCAAGLSGELEIKAPTLFKGYFNNPEATAQAFTEDGYFKTGDLGYLRGDGSFVYQSRMGDTMRLGGFLVDPTEIEDVLAAQPDIESAQVVGVEINGQPRAVAFAIAKNKQCPPDTSATLKGVAKTLAAFKIPAHLWFVDEFPTTASANGQKFQRVKLRELALKKLRQG
ncbi:MAG: AMP-binding protein [Burkholderiaceae bacterium]|nr:AMP-binding protein [Burkholderiaceae bacterium]